MSRLPFLSNSARRGLLLLEWILVIVILVACVFSWHKSGDETVRKEEQTFAGKRKHRPAITYAVEEERVETFPFDPNTADSTMLLRLGLAPWQVRAIYKYRARHGRYHTPEEFKRLPGMTYELWERLGPQIRIGRQFQYIDEAGKHAVYPNQAPSVAKASDVPVISRETDSMAVRRPRKYDTLTQVDINTADSAELMRIPGIGEYRSRKIVEYRQRLGGFTNSAQVMEACRMPDDILQWVRVKADVPVRKLNINKSSLQSLMRHPYISFYQARAVVEYRKSHGDIKGVDELKGLEGFTPVIIEKLQPYLEF